MSLQHPPPPNNCNGCIQSNCKPPKCDHCEACEAVSLNIDNPYFTIVIIILIFIFVMYLKRNK